MAENEWRNEDVPLIFTQKSHPCVAFVYCYPQECTEEKNGSYDQHLPPSEKKIDDEALPEKRDIVEKVLQGYTKKSNPPHSLGVVDYSRKINIDPIDNEKSDGGETKIEPER